MIHPAVSGRAQVGTSDVGTALVYRKHRIPLISLCGSLVAAPVFVQRHREKSSVSKIRCIEEGCLIEFERRRRESRKLVHPI